MSCAIYRTATICFNYRMSKLNCPGFCSRECDIDEYNQSSEELAIMGEVASVDPSPSSDHDERVKAMGVIGAYHAGIVGFCKDDAVDRPCEGYLEDGVALKYTPSSAPVIIHCPLVARYFAGVIE